MDYEVTRRGLFDRSMFQMKDISLDDTPFNEKSLTYTTPPLTDDLELTGFPVAHLWVSSSHKDVDFYVTLEEVDKDGQSWYLTDGKLRAAFRDTKEPPFNNLGFAACIAYILITNPGYKFIFFYMICLTTVTGFVGKVGLVETTEQFITGASKAFNLYLAIVIGNAMMNTVDAMGGFTALGEVLGDVIGTGGSSSKLMLYIIAMLFGIFGINGIGSTQAMIIHGTFEPLYTALGANPGMWCMVLCLGTMISVFMYPSFAHITFLAVSQTDDMKSLLKGAWTIAGGLLIFGIIFMVVGNMIVG